ncbi:unnamed protein product [Rhizoctonia solani]|uniref:Uncharacterized protein n=1 Tax=Rhizoctonia solani TaxID=456999 RepID=A0A8H3BTL3_9AGAM|nr:unnamed protein product [Rhizoctonia solani]
MASKNTARRSSQPFADPLHIAKRKRLIAEEFARDGAHSAIKKTISWGDIGRNGADSPRKQARTSLSQSITPGLSDMSTPTPINRLRSSLKSSSSQKTALVSSRPSTQSARQSIGQPVPGFTFRAPSHDPTPRSQSQPEVINLISEETPQSDRSRKSLDNGDQVAGSSGPSSGMKQGTNSQRIVDPPAPMSPTSDVGTQHQEQHTFDEGRASPNHVSSLRPNTDVAASQKRPVDHSGPQSTAKHPSVRPTSPSRRKRRTSEMGIQTVPDREVDWLGDLDQDDSRSAIEISRVWAERRSGTKGGEGEPHDWQPEPEPDEPLTGNFLDEFEGRSTNNGEGAPESLDGNGHQKDTDEVLDGREQSSERDVASQAVDQEDVSGHAPHSSRASSLPAHSALVGQSGKSSTGAVSYPHSASSPLRFPSSPPHENISNHPQSSIRPYSFNLQERKLVGTSGRPGNDKNDTQVDTQPRPFASSQPNPFVTEPRARSRLYTPQPSPARGRTLNELRAAPTLGRSTLGNIQSTIEPAKSADHPSSRVESDAPSEEPNSKSKSLRAAPTLGRSTDWGHVRPSRPVATDSNERNEPDLGHQPTDYDAEYGSVPEAPSDFPSRPPSSPAHHAWEIEPVHASTPHRLVTQMSTMAQALTQEAKSAKANSLAESAQPSTLAALEKRRRTSVAPLAEYKKIRREYDTVESNAVPNLRAHRDTYDESGRRSWVPKRPTMKRALDAPTPGANRGLRSKHPTTVAKELESAEQVHGQAPPESATESRAETFHPASFGETMQEHQLELDEHPGQVIGRETADNVPRPSTEIAETPQSNRIRDPYDLATSELQFHQFTSEQPDRITSPEHTDSAYVLPPNQPDASAMREDGSLAVNANREDEPASAPVVEPAVTSSQVKSSRRTRSDDRPIKKLSPRPKRPSSGLHITPARQPVSSWSTPRTRLSMGGRSGISVLQASKSDQDILVQAGLRPVLKRLSQAHGFTVDVVAEVYQEMGSLKDTEDTLEKMKHSAERMRVSISRRRSTLEVSHREERDLPERDSSEVSADYLNWDTSRMSSRILFGEGL